MGQFSDDMLATAIELIDEFGNNIILQKASSQTYNPITGKTETVNATPIPIIATFEAYQAEEVRGLVQAGDIKSLVYFDSTITYDIDSDKLIVDSIEYNLKNVSPVKTQDQVIIYELQLRR